MKPTIKAKLLPDDSPPKVKINWAEVNDLLKDLKLKGEGTKLEIQLPVNIPPRQFRNAVAVAGVRLFTGDPLRVSVQWNENKTKIICRVVKR